MKWLLILLITLSPANLYQPYKCSYILSENTALISDYSTYNYFVEKKGKTITVESNFSPLKIKAAYPYKFKDKELINLIKKNRESANPVLTVFAEQISKESKDYYSCVDKTLKFMSEKFKYTNREKGLFEGDCNTAAKTTIDLLALSGIPAKITYAIVCEKQKKVLSGKSLHAIIEIYYPGAGWIPSDPVKYHHFIPSTYIIVKKPSSSMLGLTVEKKKCLEKKVFADILKGRLTVYKLPNLFKRF